MGVAGAGKTTIGTLLAETLGWGFLDADSLHARASVEKMRSGIALEDADRAPWLDAVRARLVDAGARGRDIVVACSALKESYRTYLSAGLQVTWVYLTGSKTLIRQRLEGRVGHFMGAAMLRSQVDALEEPSGVVVADVSRSPREIVEQILEAVPPAGHD